MVGWLYIDQQVAAPIRVLDLDPSSGMLSIAIAAKFLSRHEALRGQTLVEYRDWKHRREVRCLSSERVGDEVLIDAVDLGMPDEAADHPEGIAEDWLVIDGQALSQVAGFRAGGGPGTVTGHCVMRVPLPVWRDLRIGAGAALASVGVPAGVGDHEPGTIAPLLQQCDPYAQTKAQPTVEVVRLRERLRYRIVPIATDWHRDSTLVISRVDEAETIGG